jgi:hypothetical protein
MGWLCAVALGLLEHQDQDGGEIHRCRLRSVTRSRSALWS